MPVFIDTLNDLKATKRFSESYGSYPVLRVHDLRGGEIGGRINTNKTAGIVAPKDVLEQLNKSLKRFKKKK